MWAETEDKASFLALYTNTAIVYITCDDFSG